MKASTGQIQSLLAIGQKVAREGEENLSQEERSVLAIEALEREVTPEFAAIIVDSLEAVGCAKTRKITKKAIDAQDLSSLNVAEVNAAMAAINEGVEEKLNQCDAAYFQTGEDIPGRVLSFIRARRGQFRL